MKRPIRYIGLTLLMASLLTTGAYSLIGCQVTEDTTTTSTVTINGTVYTATTTASPEKTEVALNPDPFKTSEPTMEVTTVTTTPAIDFKVSAADLYAEFQADAVAADAKYKGKLLEVTGTVTDATSQLEPRKYFVWFRGIKAETDPNEAIYLTPNPPIYRTGGGIYAYASSGKNIGWTLVYTGYCLGFDGNVLLVY